MVGKIVGTAAFLSLLACVWLLLAQAHFTPWALAAGLFVFLVIGAFATLEPREWQKRPRA